jgi:hypothetical protein
MATRNPNNVIEFGKVNFGAPITVYLVTGAIGVDQQVAPGEDLEAALEAAGQKGSVIGLGEESGGAFKLYMENSAWVTTDLEATLQAVGGVFAGSNTVDQGL